MPGLLVALGPACCQHDVWSPIPGGFTGNCSRTHLLLPYRLASPSHWPQLSKNSSLGVSSYCCNAV
jgi:hypothetical protein